MYTFRGLLLAACFVIMPAYAQIPKFEHVVVVVQENRTPDNLFQGLCSKPFGSPRSCSTRPTGSQYNIETRNWLDKTSTTGFTQPGAVPLANTYDLSHAHRAFVQMCDSGVTGAGPCKMDGAAVIQCGPSCPPNPQFMYVDNSTGILNPYLLLASQYGFANYMFQTNQGPSFPAHQFLFGGTAAPSASDDAAGVFAAENMNTNGAAGCTAPTGTTVQLIRPPGTELAGDAVYPCFDHQTMGDFTSTFDWKYYTPSAGSIWTAPNAIQHICASTGPGGTCAGSIWAAHVDLKPSDILADIGNCQLRAVSWVVPTGPNSDHAKINDGGGPSWVASIVNAIGNSTACDNNTGYWRNTAIFITWDDWGGWYDHEPPPILAQPQGDYQYGFRVPLIVVSAYTPKGYISNETEDFGSIARFIEQNFAITEGTLGFADMRAKSDLTNYFTLRGAPRRFRSLAAPKNAQFFLQDQRAPRDPDDE